MGFHATMPVCGMKNHHPAHIVAMVGRYRAQRRGLENGLGKWTTVPPKPVLKKENPFQEEGVELSATPSKSKTLILCFFDRRIAFHASIWLAGVCLPSSVVHAYI